ncbi:DNA replication protein psf2 [Lithohypha guttulata]|uniref:DNA replication complex GINS protein PSF2 n=1 Tax=Lithohypha guttulata TaxID=1690604 RepID=A0AAN7SUA0_9EURO|nr:DNA replication protein psf2 [Lithohypha guttulata]
MQLVTIVPRQRLERLDLLGGPTNALIPPSRTTLPLWLALLLKRQRRINVIPPPWLDPENLREILDLETTHFQDEFSPPAPLPPLEGDTLPFPRHSLPGSRSRNQIQPAREFDAEGKMFYLSEPFLNSCTADAPPASLPYHWYEFSHLLLDAASDDLVNADLISNLLRDIREVRQAKMRRGYNAITDGSEGVRLDGVGAMEVSESRGFIAGVMGGLKNIGRSREQARREAAEEERDSRMRQDDEEDEDMT